MKQFIVVVLILCLSQVCLGKILYWPENCRFPNEDPNNRNPFGVSSNYISTSLTESSSDEECGVDNQPIMGSYFEPAFTYVGSTYQRVALIDARKARTSAARLMTPYIKSAAYKKAICLSFDYLIQGQAIEQMTIIQQERTRSKTIYSVAPNSEVTGAHDRRKTGAWRSVQMDINIREGITRYFIEVRMKSRDGSSTRSVYDVSGHGLSSLGAYRTATTNTEDDEELRDQGIVMIKGLEYFSGSCRPTEVVRVNDNLSQYQIAPTRRTVSTTTTTTPRPTLLGRYWDLNGNYQG